MKNLGRTSVQWLKAVGIHSPEQLRSVGAVAAYNKVRGRGFRVSKVLLYALEGALLGIHWNKLEDEHKIRLLNEADEPPESLF